MEHFTGSIAPAVKIENGFLTYRMFLARRKIALSEIVWAYLQEEDVNARMCCGNFDVAIGRLILLLKNGKKESLQFEGMESPKKLLDELSLCLPDIDIGYTPENRTKHQNNQKNGTTFV